MLMNHNGIQAERCVHIKLIKAPLPKAECYVHIKLFKPGPQTPPTPPPPHPPRLHTLIPVLIYWPFKASDSAMV